MKAKTELLRGVMIDDSSYWRDRLPCWLTNYAINLVTFGSYDELLEQPRHIENNDLLIGDFRFRGVRRNGYHFIKNVRESQLGVQKTYILMSVLPEHEILERIGADGLPEWLNYISKDTPPNEMAEKIHEAAHSRKVS